MDVVGADPPPIVRLVLATGFELAAQDAMALYESESIDPKPIMAPGERSLYHLLRGAILSANGYTWLAHEETERSAEALGEDPAAAGPVWLGTVRVAVACSYLAQRDFDRADREAALAAETWPANPLAEALPGERLAARGDYGGAAAAYEAAAAHSPEWLAKKLSARAKDLRQKQASTPPLFADADFLADVLSSVAANSAEKAPRQLSRFVAAARWLASKVAGSK